MTYPIHIQFKKASLGYGRKEVVRADDIELSKGNIYCVFGRNGSGKTTLLKSTAGLISCLGGSILLNGVEINSLSSSLISKQLSIVLSSKPAFSNMKVGEFISYGRYPYNDWMGRMSQADEQIIKDAIRVAKVDQFKDEVLNELSDGESQKVQISRALAQSTGIMLLDEPASHLDLINKAEIFYLLKSIGKTGEKCIVFTSHDIQFALQLADHFIVIENGITKMWSSEDFKGKRIYEEIMKSDLLNIDGDNNAVTFKSP